MFHGKFPAGSSNHVLLGINVDKLKAVAECISLTHHGEDVYIAERQFEFQANHLAHRNLDAQHGGDARLADVDGVAPNHSGISRVDTNIYFERKPGMTAEIHRRVKLPIFELTTGVQAAFRKRLPCEQTRLIQSTSDAPANSNFSIGPKEDRLSDLRPLGPKNLAVLLIGFSQTLRLKKPFVHAVQLLLLRLGQQ